MSDVSAEYRTIVAVASGEITVKRSRFLAQLGPASNEADARGFIEEIRRTHRDARHHCTALVVGPDRAIRRSSDDGEPSGTGGAPILEALDDAALTNVVAVVTRWFGGTLLGTGGLSRAYSDAVRAALADAQAVTMRRRRLLHASLALDEAPRVEHLLRAKGVSVMTTYHADAATLRLAVELGDDGVTQLVAEVVGHHVSFSGDGDEWVSAPA